ncbi:phage tail tape measure protein [Salipiger sp. IMCC34102]|uniref:phage tail tape measure protein n=1 Tax=Salipiger sp. IMCC34102 TaxID=2510647 RepID=UPI00101C39BB|nr:phage tail tape measure protein [Salipiger sp. IMCC34102]RYH04137.1 phage tail tape measure protein [Salipiger sp. IMCC34102]
MSREQKLKSTITIGAALERSVRSSMSFLQNGLKSVGNEIKGVTNRQKELDRERDVLRRQGRSVEALDREYEELGRTLQELERKQERYNRAAAASRRVGASFRDVSSNLRRDAGRVAVGVGLASAAVFGLASSTASLGDDVAKTADRLGMGIGALQEYRYAAERSGVDIGTFDKSIQGMQKRLGEAAEGTGPAAEALERLGLSASSLSEMEPEEALGAIADAMLGVESQAEQTILANDLLGRSGVEMLNMLRLGSEGMRDLARQGSRTGYVLSEKAARDAEVFQDRLLDVQLVMQGLKNTVGAELMPVVSDAMTQFSDYMIENRDQVEVWAKTFATGVGDALPILVELASGLGEVAGVTFEAASGVADLVGGWENFGVLLGGLAFGKTILSVGLLGANLVRLGGAVALLNPVGLAIAAIAGGAYLIYKKWDKVGPWFGKLWEGVEQTFGGVRDFIVGVFTLDMERAKAGILQAWSGVGAQFSTYLTGIGDAFRWAWDSTIGPIMNSLGYTSAIVAGWETVKTSVGAALDWLGEKFEEAMARFQPVIDALKWVQEKGSAAVAALGIGDGGSVVDRVPTVGATQGGETGTSRALGNIKTLDSGGSETSLMELVAPTQVTPEEAGIRPNARGGSYGRGWHLTGEHGPELKFETRSGFVATNRQLRDLAEMSDRAAAAPRERSAPASPAPSASSAPSIVQNITHQINAAGLSVEQLIAELKRRERQAASGALYDRVPRTGLAGR